MILRAEVGDKPRSTKQYREVADARMDRKQRRDSCEPWERKGLPSPSHPSVIRPPGTKVVVQ